MSVDTNANEVAAQLLAVGVKAGVRAYAVVTHYTALQTTAIVRRASLPRTGPPGPRIQTGNYVRSWSSQVRVTPGGVVGTSGTSAPQGMRLEFGFNGTDSLGRRYNQPPYPHAGPGHDEVAAAFVAAVGEIVGDVD